MLRLFLLLACTVACRAQWPVPKSAEEAADYVDRQRSKARELWEKGDARGFEMIAEARRYLDQALVRDLAGGNARLTGRRVNIYMDLAEANALLGKTAECLDYLRRAAEVQSTPELAAYLQSSPSFAKVRQEAGFVAILERLRNYGQYWDSEALNTPFRQNLPDPEKLAGLSKFWSEIKYNFGYPEKLVELDWDGLYLQWIPKVLATDSTAAYYRQLMLLCARLSDGHTNIMPPPQADLSAKPPLRTGLVDERVVVLEVASPSLEAQGVRAGMEIVQVDGEAAVAYARRDVEPYVSASTPHDRELRTFWYGFLQGPMDKPVRLKLRDAAGAETEREIARLGYFDIRGRPPLEWRMLDNNVAYVALNSFGASQIVDQWAQVYPKIAVSSALVLDLRLNGGGDSGFGYEILRYLMNRPFPISRQVTRSYDPTRRARGAVLEWIEIDAGEISPRPGTSYSNPVIVLTSAATYSAAEDFLVAWKNSGRGKVVGEPTGGSTGQPLLFTLPGGGTARVCTKRDTFPDGRVWVGKGIDPDILVRPTLADVQAGRDTVLARALEELKTR